MAARSYTFHHVERCEMCHAPLNKSRILGLRLDGTQGLNPRSKTGVAVTVQQCLECDFVFANPEPRPVSLDDHYNIPVDEYWNADQLSAGVDVISRPYPKIKELLGFAPGMKALDVGTGVGRGFQALQMAGFDTWALEPSPSFHAKALELTGAGEDRILLASAEDAALPQEQFDLVTFGAVFEHLYDPLNLLKRSLEWLRPGGVWYAEVPSSNHLIARLVDLFFRFSGTSFTTHLSPMHSPYHIHEFTLKTFLKVAEQTKQFEVVHHFYEVCPVRHLPSIFHPILARFMEKTETGLQLHIYLRRK